MKLLGGVWEVSIMFELIKIFEGRFPSASLLDRLWLSTILANKISCVLPDKMISVFF